MAKYIKLQDGTRVPERALTPAQTRHAMARWEQENAARSVISRISPSPRREPGREPMMRWGGTEPTGSRDPIRVYLEERRRQDRLRALAWVLTALVMGVVLWAMLVTVIVWRRERSAFSSKSPEWYTPQSVILAFRPRSGMTVSTVTHVQTWPECSGASPLHRSRR